MSFPMKPKDKVSALYQVVVHVYSVFSDRLHHINRK